MITIAPPASPWPIRLFKAVAFLVIVFSAILLARQYGEELTPERLAQRESSLRQMVTEHPWQTYGGALLLYVMITGLCLPGAVVMSIVYGWLFDFWPALVVVSFGSSIGATIAFLLSRFLFRDYVRRLFGDRLDKFNAALRRDGAVYLLTLRLIPGVPYFVINLVMGLTPIKTWTFYWVSQLGMLAGTAVFVFAGSSLGSLDELAKKGPKGLIHPRTLVAFVLLSAFSMTMSWAYRKLQAKRDAESKSEITNLSSQI